MIEPFLCTVCLLLLPVTIGTHEDDGTTEELYDCVYINFVEEVDAVDNGISDRDGTPR